MKAGGDERNGGGPVPGPRPDWLALLEALPAWRFICDTDDRVVECHCPEGHGTPSSSDLRGRRVAEALPAPGGERLADAVRRCRTTDEGLTVQYQLDLPGGKRTYEASVVPLQQGRVGVVSLDISLRAATLDALRKSEERFRLAFKTSPDSIAINRATDGQYVATNEGFTELLGYREDEAVGRTSLELGVWDRPEEREAMLAELRRCGRARIEGHFRRKNGEVGIGVLSAVLFDLDGLPHILSVTRDVTQEREAERERLRLETALRQSQKLEALGRLAGGIAHDFNNLLTGILGYADLVERSIRKGAPRSLDVQQIRRTAERARDLTRQLLAFARRQPAEPRVVSFNDAVRSTEGLLRRVLGEQFDLVVRLAPDLWRVEADASQLEQVFLNLAINARDAMTECGTLAVETANVERDADQAAQGGGMAGPQAMLSVGDTGAGLSSEALSHLFEPFFTTKPGGTGLGLATVYGIVQQNGGHIEVSSEPGRGSTFRVYLPRTAKPEAEDADPAREPGEAPAGTETILLIEDDETVREFVELTLREAGYRVLVAGDGPAALRLAQPTDASIQLLLTDIVLPAMSGREVAASLRARRPGLKVLYMSGYDQASAGGLAGSASGREPLLAKPFTASQLQRKVREVL